MTTLETESIPAPETLSFERIDPLSHLRQDFTRLISLQHGANMSSEIEGPDPAEIQQTTCDLSYLLHDYAMELYESEREIGLSMEDALDTAGIFLERTLISTVAQVLDTNGIEADFEKIEMPLLQRMQEELSPGNFMRRTANIDERAIATTVLKDSSRYGVYHSQSLTLKWLRGEEPTEPEEVINLEEESSQRTSGFRRVGQTILRLARAS